MAALPERERTENVPWAVPILGDRIPSESKAIEMGNKQVKKLFKTDNSSWSKELSVLVADSVYSQRDFIGEQVKEKNLVTITRVRSNRVFYRQFIDNNTTKRAGHPRWYGDRFDLKDETTWHPPDEVLISDFITKKGRKFNLRIWGWKEMLMKGTSNYKMNRHPFTLLQITITDEKGNNVWKPMWLIVIGSRRDELSLEDCYQAYRQRYDLEHLFRFGKQKLLMTSSLTPDVKHEENWFKLTLLAYVNLWTARNLAVVKPARMGTIFEDE